MALYTLKEIACICLFASVRRPAQANMSVALRFVQDRATSLRRPRLPLLAVAARI
jgi:hypothetical protein